MVSSLSLKKSTSFRLGACNTSDLLLLFVVVVVGGGVGGGDEALAVVAVFVLLLLLLVLEVLVSDEVRKNLKLLIDKFMMPATAVVAVVVVALCVYCARPHARVVHVVQRGWFVSAALPSPLFFAAAV